MSFFVGLPTSSTDFHNKGVEPLLDYLHDTVKVNAVITAARTFVGDACYETHDEYYAFTRLRDRPSDLKKKGFDLLGELTQRAHDRGMAVYSHFLSYDFIKPSAMEFGKSPNIDENGFEILPNAKLQNLSHVLEIDLFGRKTVHPCLNNPDYREYHYAVVEDQLRSYAIDGINFNIERDGPITQTLLGGTRRGRKPLAPGCFCPHCLQSAHDRGINVDRVKAGYTALLEFSERSWQAAKKAGDPVAAQGFALLDNRDTAAPPDGYFIEFMRILSRYPEILAWSQMWYDNLQDLMRGIYGTVKAVSPSRKLGFHVWHPRDYNPLERAFYNMRDMRRYCDWIKPKMDHTCGGFRYNQMVHRFHQALFYDRSIQQAASAMNAVFNWDTPHFDALPTDGLGLDYLEKDTKAYIADVYGEVPIYPGIGIDMPAGDPGHIFRPCEPQYVRDGLLTIAKAGAKGTVLSRGFGEMQDKNMVAAGETIDEINRLYKFD
jgi:hypothetical protein